MAVSRKVEREIIRKSFLEKVSQFLAESGEEVLLVKSNEIAIPVVGCEGNEDFLVLTFKEKERKAEERKAEKERKIKRDEEIRKRKAEIHDK